MAGRGVLLVSALLLAVAAATACGGEETKPTATATPTPGQPTAAATATGAAGAGRVKLVPTLVHKVTPTPAATIAATATTPAPPPGGETPELTPAWETSAPREPVAGVKAVELGLRNKYGEPGECYDFTMKVSDPLYFYSDFGTVCADEWTYLRYWNPNAAYGTHDVYFFIGLYQLIAQDSFEFERVVE